MSVGAYLSSFLESVKKFWNEVDLKKWSEDIGGSSSEAVEAAMYFGLCFCTGFLFKKYCKIVITCLVFSVILIKVMEYNHLIGIDWNAMSAMFGLESATDFNSLLNLFFDWIKNHLLLFIASSVGFLVGYKLG
jgi:uncharacterized membrane protein (Fun14 family)